MSRSTVVIPSNRVVVRVPKGGQGASLDAMTMLVDEMDVPVDDLAILNVTSVVFIPSNRAVAFVGLPGPGTIVENLALTVDEYTMTVDELAA